jgi:putative ABC transport system ATP-binding protein
VEPLYTLRGVTKFFQRGPTTVRALDGIDLEIAAGEFVALEGPSGSGKTTLLQLLGALDRPSGGDVRFEGADLVGLPDHDLAELRLRSFGFVFQQFNLIPTLTAVENVEAKLVPAGGEIIDLLENLAREHGSTVIVATHDSDLAARAPQRLAMRDGKLVGRPAPAAA